MPSFALASTWTDMWQTKNQQGQNNFDIGNHAGSAELFEDSNWKGAAYYKAKDYKNAYEQFQKDDSAIGLYNQANALTQSAEYDKAIESYKKAIEKRPDFEDAKDNLEIAKKLKEQKKQNQDNKNDGDDKNNQPKDEGSNNEKKDSDKPDKNGNKEKPSDNAGDKKPKDDMSDQANNGEPDDKDVQSEQEKAEQRQAQLDKKQTENMLARISDDPGGLLKQKFLRDYQRRTGGMQ